MTAYDVAVYYFPNYHAEPRNDATRGPGWTEWDEVRRARPRFPGHQQPKVPLWGYQDESDPAVMAQKIDAAADHGVTTFIFDWYWDEDGPMLSAALEQGFLAAPNNDRLRFSVMWANHWPLARPAFDRATDHIIHTYLTHPSYQTIDDKAYVSIYELATLMDGLGGVDQTRDALDHFRQRAHAHGIDLHLNAVHWGVQMGDPTPSLAVQNNLLATLGVDSVTSYVWIHHAALDHFPDVPYARYAADALTDWERFSRDYALPYYPNVTVGWDPSPRTDQAAPFALGAYPATAVLTDNTPERFEAVLREARAFLDRGLTAHPLLTIYAWNEWAEGGYLEPDTTNGWAYLEAIKRVFGPASPPTVGRQGA